ncbi:MAG: conjugal transfer protein trbe [Gammaproteobacteria bacterium]|jgi:type IV secretion system protein VirB4|nr:conjugal transfer protein trbe [Gammaproteobacteria bacterium]
MFKLGAFQKDPNCLADVLPWAAIVAPGIILNKDGSLQRTCRFRGPDLESASEEQMTSAMARLNNVLRRLTAGWAVYVEARREPLVCTMPDANFPDKLSLLIDLEHHKRFTDTSLNFHSQYFLTLQYLPDTQLQKSLWRNFIQQSENLQQAESASLQEFIDQTERIFNILHEQCFEASFLSDEETLCYLHSTVSNRNHPIKVPEVPIDLDFLLSDTPLTGGLEPLLGDEYLKTITIIGFPAASTPAILDRLNYLPFGYRWVTRYIALDKLEAEKTLKRHRQRWFAKRKSVFNLLQEVLTKQESALQDNAAVEKAKEVDEALDLLSRDTVSYGYFTCTVTVKNVDKTVVNEQIKEIERAINGLGFTTILESVNAVEAWLSSLPGQAYANVRKPLLHTLNLSHLIPFSAVWSGQAKDEHLDASPLFYAYTYGNTPFRFVSHIGDVGHHMMIGPTGAGKSVFLNFFALQFTRYPNARVIIFDKGRSFLASTNGVGGKFYELGSKKGLHFQPLADIDQADEASWAAEWVLALCQNEKIEITPDVKRMVWQALQSLSTMPKHQRTLSGLVALMQDHSLRQALHTYTIAGPFGQLLDANEDNLQKNPWVCFEMEDLMNMPSVIAPVLAYLFHRLEKDFQGEPTLLILDEAWLFLDHPIFVNKIRDWLKSLRKRNVSVIFATQSVADSARHTIAPTLLESCAARIFLPNDRALEPQIKEDYLRLGLNEKQLHILANAQAKKHYYYQSGLGNRLFSLELAELALAFCASSSPTDIQWLQAHHDLDHLNLLKQFLFYKNLPWAAEILA